MMHSASHYITLYIALYEYQVLVPYNTGSSTSTNALQVVSKQIFQTEYAVYKAVYWY